MRYGYLQDHQIMFLKINHLFQYFHWTIFLRHIIDGIHNNNNNLHQFINMNLPRHMRNLMKMLLESISLALPLGNSTFFCIFTLVACHKILHALYLQLHNILCIDWNTTRFIFNLQSSILNSRHGRQSRQMRLFDISTPNNWGCKCQYNRCSIYIFVTKFLRIIFWMDIRKESKIIRQWYNRFIPFVCSCKLQTVSE